ncbi:hypothetical protein PVK06_009690 [Gossypium arboreum]|uniref:Uncharacterized protein n=1 Tax=Gossypium arboreum TaxID=29729 RepID=A0ABR0QP36_GOSAR|nr:hypothetical protein PVK06_009690 [Gossypium arboreum]
MARLSERSRKLFRKQNTFDTPWMDKLLNKKLPRKFIDSIPIIKVEAKEDLEEFLNWIVEYEFEENLKLTIENFPYEDIEFEIEENAKMDSSE